MSDYFKNAVLWLIILGVLILIFSNVSDRNKPAAMKYSDFVAAVNAGQIKQVTIDGLNISGEKTNGSSFETVRPQVEDTELLPSLNKQNVVVEGTAPQRQGILMQLLIASFPVLLIILLFMFFMRNMGGGAGGKNGPMSFGKSKAKMLSEDQIKVTFADVAGCDEAKQEVVEIVDFLKDPAKFKRLGATIPRGVLMVGPPGQVKHYWQKPLRVKPRFLSSVSLVLTLLRCLLVWVRPVFAICSNRQNAMHHVSSLLMRLMRWVVTVVQVQGVVMMSVNKP